MRGARAEGHADADFTGPPRDSVGEHAVEADGNKNRRGGGEYGGQGGDETLLPEGGFDVLLHGADFVRGQTGADAGQHGAQLRDDTAGRSASTDVEGAAVELIR